jgi:hypothetical protein
LNTGIQKEGEHVEEETNQQRAKRSFISHALTLKLYGTPNLYWMVKRRLFVTGWTLYWLVF